MTETTAVISMIHEVGLRQNSAQRLFRAQPVLAWTLGRLAACERLESVTVLCWEEQLADVTPLADEAGAYILAKGPTVVVPQVAAISAARRWSDGWRGGLQGTCHFDAGFYAPWVLEIVRRLSAEGVVVVDPAAGLIDPVLVDGLIEHADLHPDEELCFSPAAPGLGSVLLRAALLERLASARMHPGKLVHYSPDVPGRDPISTDACAPVPAVLARTPHRFTLDSDRQVQRIEQATISLNGQLISTPGEELVCQLDAAQPADLLPREVVLELTVERKTRPIYSPAGRADLQRGHLSMEHANQLLAEISASDDIRLTLGGVGDPLLWPGLFELLDHARDSGIRAVHVETDLISADEATVKNLAAAPIDVISVHLPATSPETYARVMGVDGLLAVIERFRLLLNERARLGRSTPLVVPTFTKCRENLAEMEAWYDTWLRAVGSAVIVGPSEFGGEIPGVAVADMAPPRRKPCARIESRVTILSDGRIVSCEEDLRGRQAMGRLGEDTLGEVWRGRFGEMRRTHAGGLLNLNVLPVCASCKEWHRAA